MAASANGVTITEYWAKHTLFAIDTLRRRMLCFGTFPIHSDLDDFFYSYTQSLFSHTLLHRLFSFKYEENIDGWRDG